MVGLIEKMNDNLNLYLKLSNQRFIHFNDIKLYSKTDRYGEILGKIEEHGNKVNGLVQSLTHDLKSLKGLNDKYVGKKNNQIIKIFFCFFYVKQKHIRKIDIFKIKISS